MKVANTVSAFRFTYYTAGGPLSGTRTTTPSLVAYVELRLTVTGSPAAGAVTVARETYLRNKDYDAFQKM